jgi:hypothetical protein
MTATLGVPWLRGRCGVDGRHPGASGVRTQCPVIEVIKDLAAGHGLVIWDPQSEDAYLLGH